MAHTAVRWKHCYTPITFTLVVGGFGVKYTDERHADHLHRALTIFTASPPTEMGRNISTSYSNGTTMNVPLTSVCPMMTRKPCTSYNIPPLPDPKTPHTLGFPHNMDALVNNHHAMTQTPHYHSGNLSIYKKYAVPSCTMYGWLEPPC